MNVFITPIVYRNKHSLKLWTLKKIFFYYLKNNPTIEQLLHLNKKVEEKPRKKYQHDIKQDTRVPPMENKASPTKQKSQFYLF